MHMVEDFLSSSLFGVLLGPGLAYFVGARSFRRKRFRQMTAQHIALGTAGLTPSYSGSAS